MNLLNQFSQQANIVNLFSPKDKLLIAVSGGVDSVVLCELCKQAGYDFSIAHCNFKLRGAESERDEQFVRTLAKKYNAEIFVKVFYTEKYARENKLSTQEAARNLRYEWFTELITNQKSEIRNQKYLLTAHHADDNNETLLMNFFRGTGLHGLTGIAQIGSVGIFNFIRRPLLEFSKEQLIDFAKENNLDFVEDSSNESSKYTRNFFRNELIPAITRVYPQVKENLQDNINRFKEIEKLYQLSVNDLKNKICKQKGNETHIPVKKLMSFNNKALIYEIISPFGFNEKQVDELIKLAESDTGKYIQSPSASYRIIKNRHWFIISPLDSTDVENIIIEEGKKEIHFALGILQIAKTSNLKPQTLKETILIDSKDLSFPLLLRKWKTGDYFYPLGMKKKKKINRFLIDQKLSLPEKEKIWVLESNYRIVWVVGLRMDDRFKMGDATKEAIQLTVKT